MDHQRSLLVALRGGSADASLVRYAALVARLNCGANRMDRDEKEPSIRHGTEPSPASGPALVQTAESKAIVITTAVALRFIEVPSRCSTTSERDGRPRWEWVRAQLAEQAEAVPVQYGTLEGRAGERLLELASEEDSDLVLVGEGSDQRRLAGRLVREAACSVWLVPKDAPPAIRRILVPVDFSMRAADSLRVATTLARLSRAAECLALHVCFDGCVVVGPDRQRQFHEEVVEAYTRFAAEIDCLGVKVTPLFREGADVARTVLRTAEEQAADLIVMASRGRTRAGALMGESLAGQVLRASPVPLLVVKHFGAHLGLLQAVRERAFGRKGDLHFN